MSFKMGEGAKDGELKEVEGVLVVEKAEEIGEGVDRRMVRDCEGREGVFQSKFLGRRWNGSSQDSAYMTRIGVEFRSPRQVLSALCSAF